MSPITRLTNIVKTKKSENFLVLKDQNVSSHKTEVIIDTFASISKDITAIDLSNNYLQSFISSDLIRVFEAIPVQVTTLILSGNPLFIPTEEPTGVLALLTYVLKRFSFVNLANTGIGQHTVDSLKNCDAFLDSPHETSVFFGPCEAELLRQFSSKPLGLTVITPEDIELKTKERLVDKLPGPLIDVVNSYLFFTENTKGLQPTYSNDKSQMFSSPSKRIGR
ncbi:MAG: hypothetical protein H0U75_10340 [Legionella sp.]|nr:hypothetical protein [Legionella sp.]